MLEVGAAIVALFYSIFKLRRGDTLDKNRLDREGFKRLIDLHFQNVRHNVFEVFDDLQFQNKVNPSAINRDLAVQNVRRVLKEARDKLTVFKAEGMDDIGAFLAGNFPQDQLDKFVNEGLNIAFAHKDPREQRKRVFELIRNVQAELLEKINVMPALKE